MKDLNFDVLNEVPTEAMTEIKSNVLPEDITANTTAPVEQLFNNGNSTGQPDNLNTNPQAQQLNAGNLINAEMAVSLVDVVAPVALVLLFKRALNKTVSKKSFQLTNTEKETIKPVLQNYLNSINFSIEKPIDALIITLMMIYGVKAVEVMNDTPSGKFESTAAGIGQPTAQGTIKQDGRGRPKGTFKKPKQVI